MNSAVSLRSLADSYPPAEPEELLGLADQFRRQGESEILDLAAIAADLTADSLLDLGLEPESNPLLVEAFRLQNPGLEIGSLPDASAAQLGGYVNALKGKYFEVLVKDRLNKGEALGELVLGPGQEAVIAESLTQPGWDLKIVNVDDGSTVELLQLKATESMSYVREALDRYPDIRVATTSEIDGTSEMILSTDIPDEEVEVAARQFIDEADESPITDVIHGGAEMAFDSIPIVPAIMIIATEGRQLLAGQADVEESLTRIRSRLGEAAKISTAGAIMGGLSEGILAAPASVAMKIAIRRSEYHDAMTTHLKTNLEELRSIPN